ncbi:hypothetical protein QBC47DRAFT_438852 [Echria macrotheca]|uniref:Uncharacterized protein n=1 Tax=Echria macrotheca TaxID=438768 RepID=A0AAJ0B2Q5_9PEZI|nr:hypothetical protein QBC47DRAFT_438852 [Echria macrotheca]
MDNLRKQGYDEFLREQRFDPPSHGLVTLLRLRGDEEAGSQSPPEIKQTDDNPLVTRLDLVRVDRQPDGHLLIQKEAFLRLVYAFQLDPEALYMLRRESYGFARLHGAHGDTTTYYLATISAVLIWSQVERSTRGIIVPRIADSLCDRDQIFTHYAATICAHARFVRHPWLLRHVAVVETASWIDRTYENALHSLRRAESSTGHGCWGSWDRATAETTTPAENLAEISKSVGFTAAALANVVRHIKIVNQLVALPLEDDKGADDGVDDVLRAHAFVREQMAARATDTDYLQERARTQLQVIFNLINHHEASTSRQIAAAAKEDSASMRVLALMTVVFLPGTFFAALFSVPTLRWSEDSVMGPRFWVYWAFTLPCTLSLVLVIYGLSGGGRCRSWISSSWARLRVKLVTSKGRKMAEVVDKESIGKA